MGVEYNYLGVECESSKQAKGEEIRMGGDNNFYTLIFCARGARGGQERELGDGATMEG
jgi:hypothetical protein